MSSSANQLVKSREFQQHCAIYKNTKENIKKRSESLQKVIETNTKKEVEDLKLAYKNLDKKMENLMKHPKVKEEKSKIEKDYKDMQMSLDKVMQIFSEARNVIMQDKSLNYKQKSSYLAKLEDKMMEKLYDKEEISKFKRMVSNMVIMIPNHPQLLSGDRINTEYGLNNNDRKQIMDNNRTFDISMMR